MIVLPAAGTSEERNQPLQTEAVGSGPARDGLSVTLSLGEIPAPVALEILPHEKAPVLSSFEGPGIFKDLVTLVMSGDIPTGNQEIQALLREAGFVSLWFFLRAIAAYNGPYERLTNHLHVDMANHYQRFLYPGSWSAFFLPRSMFKSTVVTSGGNAWELLRNPDLTIAMGSSITDRSIDFQHETQRIFDGNEFFSWLYPEYVPERGQRSWNDREFTLPNRSRRKRSPSMQTLAVGASSQGIHVELLKLDDIVGDAQLNSERGANADMRRIGNWFRSNKRTLLDRPEADRIVATGTRYSVEDPWEQIMLSVKSKHGTGWENIPRGEGDDGEWHVYYRQAVEDGLAIFPEGLSVDAVERMREDDPWNYLTQYLNNPYTQESAELSEYVPEEARVEYDPNDKGWLLHYESFPGKFVTWRLEDCDVVAAVDPAATEKSSVTAKSSRSALAVVVTCPDGTAVIVDGKADYVPISKVFDWMFTYYDKWRPRITSLEQNGPFKMLSGLIYDEQMKRRRWIGIVAARGVGDKDVRIRTELQPRLSANKLRVTENVRGLFMGELVAFPAGWKKDFLDAVSQALMKSVIPASAEQVAEDEDDYEEQLLGRSKYTGY